MVDATAETKRKKEQSTVILHYFRLQPNEKSYEVEESYLAFVEAIADLVCATAGD